MGKLLIFVPLKIIFTHHFHFHGQHHLLQDLGAACGSRRPTCMVMVKQHDDYTDLYDECADDVKGMPMPI